MWLPANTSLSPPGSSGWHLTFSMKYSMEHEYKHYVTLPGPACNTLKSPSTIFEFGSHILKAAEGLVSLGSLNNYMEQSYC